MKREIIDTGDGSKSINIPEWKEQYHSKHGALQEALHVFIEMGLKDTLSRKQDPKETISIIEYGLGTGLNAMLTAQFLTDTPIHYTGVDAYPVTYEEAMAVNYGELLKDETLYKKLHSCEWEQPVKLTSNFTIEKLEKKFKNLDDIATYDVIYYDCFGPRVQPDLWKLDMFQAAYASLKPEGVLVTYCAQGQARRNMIEAGFTVEKLVGPPGKREMLRARKL
ncbi:MAG: tRNA (5-methylaminomethyl-2-thiouridine)(34)-methyltransferase MnmD [Nonlabens sp.]|uniref:tRNA (5-methylaminomethyl-2-thiouridine)(34)-methyltransferase MnmD n=1 Tax=Nonlabens sp. TaxID=1888209 RepID=UPI003EF7FFCA